MTNGPRRAWPADAARSSGVNNGNVKEHREVRLVAMQSGRVNFTRRFIMHARPCACGQALPREAREPHIKESPVKDLMGND